jgi:HEAT repeat protein/cyclophilin family peptidyl-prolyl cis-trans isomerase
MRRPIVLLLAFFLVLTVSSAASRAQGTKGRPLGPADMDAITQLVKLEDTRQLDEATLTKILQSAHPEVRRRAVITIGRIVDPRSYTLLIPMRSDPDPEVVASVAFAAGQLKSADAVTWLGEALSSPKTPQAVAFEAARALGKIRSADARIALSKYLTEAPATAATAPIVGEALLAIGRFTPPGDIAPIVRWTTVTAVEVRWRAAWALFRPRDPAAVPHLLLLSKDPSGDVRFWAVRGLAPALVDKSTTSRAVTSAGLREAVKDPDRRVRTEALRALAAYDDDESFAVVVAALDSPDTWLSVSAAEALGRFQARKEIVVPKLVAAMAPARPLSLRVTALTPLAALAPDAAVDPAEALLHEKNLVAQTAAAQALRSSAAGRARLEVLAADPATQSLVPAAGGGGGGGRGRSGAPPRPVRSDAEYRRIVEQWIVPDYNGGAKPHVILETPRGTIEIELYPGDAPMGVEYLQGVVTSGAIVGTEFGRVVPNFVAQQRAISSDAPLRDEVNRRGLTRGNLSWASSGLDTGRPGYTLGSTPQPHNEGDFTALGRVIRGLDVVDHLELGDRITGAKMVR